MTVTCTVTVHSLSETLYFHSEIESCAKIFDKKKEPVWPLSTKIRRG